MIRNMAASKQTSSSLSSLFQGFVLFIMMFSLAAVSEADERSSRLESHFDADSAYSYFHRHVSGMTAKR